MRLVAPTCTATFSTGLSLAVQSAEVTLDAGQAPYVQVRLTCAAPDASAVAAIDPRQGQRLSVQLNDHADLFGGTATSRTLSLLLTGRSRDAGAGTMLVTAMSDEAALIGRGLMAKTTKTWSALTVQQLVGAVLGSLGYACTFGASDYSISSDALTQQPGQSYWDFLDGTLQGGNLRLWADTAGVFHLDDKSTVLPGRLSLQWGVDLTELVEDIDITSEAYMDALVVRFSYLDGAGNPQTAYDYATSTATPLATGVVEFNTPPAVAGTARRLLRRMTGRGRTLQQEAVARFDVTPGQSFAVTMPDGLPPQAGLVQSVTWRHPDTRMVVSTRELSDTVPTMWAAQPAGTTWASIPAGVSWSRYLAIPWSSAAAGVTWASLPAGLRWNEYGS